MSMLTALEPFLEDYAAKSRFTTDELRETAEDLHSALQKNLHHHFRKCRLEAGSDYLILEEPSGVWLAFTHFEFAEEMRHEGIEFEEERLRRVAYASLKSFQSSDLTIAVPGSVARYIKDPFYIPFFVHYPDGWKGGEFHSLQRIQEFVSRYEMSPAEALDYWAVEHMSQDIHEWAGKRNVQAEAIRKNGRQARRKLGDEDLGATPENGRIRAVPADEIPEDDVHNKDEDLFYTPIEDVNDE